MEHTKVIYTIPFSGRAQVAQVERVGRCVERAHQEHLVVTQATAEIAESERAAIDIGADVKLYAVIPLITLAADTLFGANMLSGAFEALGGLMGGIVLVTLAVFMAAVAVIVECFSSHLYETGSNRFIRSVTSIFGLMVPCGLAWCLVVSQHALAINAQGKTAGVDVKLWIFGALAVSLHVVLFLAGGRVRSGYEQFRNFHRVQHFRKIRAKAFSNWHEYCCEARVLDHRLHYLAESYNARNPEAQIEMPKYDSFTEQFLSTLKEQGGIPDITIKASSRHDVGPGPDSPASAATPPKTSVQ